jgi:HD-like signal output (HDOD) protein
MAKVRILFVDDEPNVLQGLQRLLRPLRDQWDMETAGGGSEALERLAQTPFDVIVSDMRMPGMDGAELLNRVMLLYPGMIRIVLSGYSNQENFSRSIGPMHQYLSKPCTLAQLENCINRACFLHDHLKKNQTLLALISRLQTLPSMPALYTQVVSELKQDEPSLEKISQLIFQDPSMTAKILQLANSSFFGFYSQIADPLRAIKVLGLDMIHSLVLTYQIFSQLDSKLPATFNLAKLWNHQLCVAQASKKLVFLWGLNKSIREEAFLAGLLHDLGQLILAANYPDEFLRLLALSQDIFPSVQAEQDALGVTHADLAAGLFALWGLPTSIIEAVLYHHQPPPAWFYPAPTAVTAVYVAEQLIQAPATDDVAPYLETLNLLDTLPSARKICQDTLAGASELEGWPHE